MTSSSTLFTQPKAAAASPRTEACGFHPDRRSDSLSSTVQVSNLHLQFASLDDYFNRADCDPDLLPALRAFGEPLRAVCLLRTEQLQTTQVCMFSGIEKPSSLTDRSSDRPICFHCTIYCLFHAYLSFLIPCLTSILYADNPLLEQICLERLRQTRPRSGGACSNMQNRIDDGSII